MLVIKVSVAFIRLTLGMVMVLMILRSSRLQSRRVSAYCTPSVGFRMVIGTTKSEVRITFLLKSMSRPWGENCSPRMLS